MIKLLMIMCGGGLGALCRYGMSGFIMNISKGDFPLGTLTVNIIGSFLIGVFWELFNQLSDVSHELKAFIVIGFLGAFTTFATFSLDTAVLYKSANYKHALLNILLNNAVCIVFVFLGAFACLYVSKLIKA
jgi:fluoride exporter